MQKVQKLALIRKLSHFAAALNFISSPSTPGNETSRLLLFSLLFYIETGEFEALFVFDLKIFMNIEILS